MQEYLAIENGIRDNDIEGLREAIGSICYTCRDFSNGEFDEAVEYVLDKGVALMDPCLDGELVSPKEEYTDEDFALAVFELKRNFCPERIEDVKTVGRALYQGESFSEGEEISEDNGAPEASFAEEERPKGQRHRAQDAAMLRAVGLMAAIVAALAVAAVMILTR